MQGTCKILSLMVSRGANPSRELMPVVVACGNIAVIFCFFQTLSGIFGYIPPFT